MFLKNIFNMFPEYALFSQKVWPEIMPLLICRVGSKIIDLSSSVLGYICIAIAIGIADEEIFTAKLRALQFPENISDNSIWLVMLILGIMSIINLIADKLALYYAHKILSKNGQAVNLNAKPNVTIENIEKAISPLLNFIDFLSELVFLFFISLIVLILSPAIYMLMILAILLIAFIRKMLPFSESPEPQNAYHRARLDVLSADPDAGGGPAHTHRIHALVKSRINLAMYSRSTSAKRTVFSSAIFIVLVLAILNVNIDIETFSLALLFLLVIRQIGATIMNMLNYNKIFIESI